jgi:hypothetical protein
MTAGPQAWNNGLESGNVRPRCLMRTGELILPLVCMVGVRIERNEERIGVSR